MISGDSMRWCTKLKNYSDVRKLYKRKIKKLMKIIALEKELPHAQAKDFTKYAKDEAKKAWEFQQDGFIREIYFRADENSAVLILEANSVDQANQKLQQLPFVENKLIEFELIPLKAYPGFARLFL